MEPSQALPISPSINGPAVNASRVYIKPPPADEEVVDLNRAYHEQRAPNPAVTAPSEMAFSPRALSETTATTTEPPPGEKSTEDLIAMIHHLQASHARELAELRNQQAALSNQLDQMKSLLSSHFNAQLGAIHLLQNVSLVMV